MDSAREAGQPSAAGPVHLTSADLTSAYPASFYTEDFAAARPLLAEGFFSMARSSSSKAGNRSWTARPGSSRSSAAARLLRQRAVSCWLDVSLQTPVKALRLRRGPGAGAASGRWPDRGCGRRA